MPGRRKASAPDERTPVDTPVLIESLDREGRGVGRVEGKAMFVEGALPGERVTYAIIKRKPSYELGELMEVVQANAARSAPACRHFGLCGGCSLQHFEARAQVAAKQRILEDAFWHIGRLRPESMLSPILGPSWGYRRRARLSARWVIKKEKALVGFRERKSTFVADMDSCEVLPPALSAAIPELSALLERLSIRERLPQIEIAAGDRVTALVLRVLEPPDEADEALLRAYAERSGFQLWLQAAGPESARPFWPLDAPPLDYALPEFDVRIGFLPTDFTQVNHDVNRVLVRRAIRLLDPRPGERIGDFFCGLGNFSLPIARSGARVVGIEGSAGLVARAAENARRNGLEAACRFEAANLFDPQVCARHEGFDKALIDPPREGAVELVKSRAMARVERLVYVSCDPATLARDAAVLVNAHGFRLAAAGVANMFPHTSHVESMALFER
jgi:23S rRNA (uracil1939-C5)-methyltransferase